MGLHGYLPEDRLHALACGGTLPDRTSGAALLADISGFTALTESLTQQLGVRRGTEDLSRQVGRVFDALIAVLERHGGSVLSFAGDAVSVWFDDASPAPCAPAAGSAAAAVPPASAALRAVAAGLAMQAAMQAFPALGLKVAVAAGSARRFLVGDPAIHYLDALAGAPVARSGVGESLARNGEVLVDEAAALALGAALAVREWRTGGERADRFGVAAGLSADVATVVPPDYRLLVPDPALLRPYVPPPVFEREVFGQGSYLAEFRPCAALFVRFGGIDYETDDARPKLDAFVRRLEQTAERHDGTVLQLIIGDKGSYAYVNFGALSAHEDDARRAVRTAIELRDATDLPVQVGISQGVMRVGAYGGTTRRTYGALGDEVNLAARLMGEAQPGEILASGAVQKAVSACFGFEPRPPLALKGKEEPVPVFVVTGDCQARAMKLQEPAYALPMVGRREELRTVEDRLDRALAGASQIVGITAEAGLGKSRLVAEAIRSARRKGFTGYGGACQSDGVHTPYLVWRTIFSAIFDLDPTAPSRRQIRTLEGEVEDRAPGRIDALPLLGGLLGIDIPDNAFTRALEPRNRQGALHALLEDCLRSVAAEGPLLLVIEDLHWIDALSQELLVGMARALADRPVCFVLAYRPPQQARLAASRLEALPQFTRIELKELDADECLQAVRAKLAQLYPARSGAPIPRTLTDRLQSLSQGNPFYLEELLNYLRDRGLDPRDPADLERIELPDSLHKLVLSRIDQLSERRRITLRMASIVGRLFRVQWLIGSYPELGGSMQVQRDLDELRDLDITSLDTPEPELAYLFKHIVLHEVTYESLPYATRARLHEQLARWLEATYPDSPPLEALAFHYGRSDDVLKQREYLRRAGEAAQRSYANEDAVALYGQLLPLLEDPAERIEILWRRGEVLELVGEMDKAGAEFQTALTLARKIQDPSSVARLQLALGKLNRLRSVFDAALEWLEKAQAGYAALGDGHGHAKALTELGFATYQKGDYAKAAEILQRSLAREQEEGDVAGAALALQYLATIAFFQGDYATARTRYEECLARWRDLGDKMGVAYVLNYLGNIVQFQGDAAGARPYFEESLALYREVGSKVWIGNLLGNLGTLAFDVRDLDAARSFQEESLRLRREIGDRFGEACAVTNLGNVALVRGDFAKAKDLQDQCMALCREADATIYLTYAQLGAALAVLGRDGATPAALAESAALLRESGRLRRGMGEKLALASNLVAWASRAVSAGDLRRAAVLLGAADAALAELGVAVESEMKEIREAALAAVRSGLQEADEEAARAEGAGMGMDAALSLAENGD